MAGIPRASLVVIAATLSQFNIPEAGLILLMGVDPFLDMGRSATNVMSNAIGAAIVGRWEGEHYGEGCRGKPKTIADSPAAQMEPTPVPLSQVKPALASQPEATSQTTSA